MQFRLLNADEIDCRVATVSQKGCSLLLYKDARVDMNMLDEAGLVWQRKHEVVNGNLFCSVGIMIDGEWVWRQDVGTESYTEKEKGQASDAFKRACFNWGIGRELYTAPFIWISGDNAHVVERNGKWTTYEKFRVTEISYDEKRNISGLTVVDSKGGVVYKMSPEVKKETISAAKVKAIQSKCKNEHVDQSKVLAAYKVETWEDMSEVQYRSMLDHWDKVVASCGI